MNHCKLRNDIFYLIVVKLLDMKILAIDTSCDETAVAVVENDWLLSNVISSQAR